MDSLIGLAYFGGAALVFAWSIGIALGGLAHPWARRLIRKRPAS
jgi:hypothetical protein